MMLQIIKTNVFKAQTSRFISESYLLSFIIQQKIYNVLILLITKPFYLPFECWAKEKRTASPQKRMYHDDFFILPDI
jgi:hypothetical protein